MKYICLAIFSCQLIFSINADAQIPNKKVESRQIPETSSTTRSAYDGDDLLVRIAADGSSRLSPANGPESNSLDDAGLKAELLNYIDSRSHQSDRKLDGPRILVDADPDLDFKTIVRTIKTLRVSKAVEVQLLIPDGPRLLVPTGPKFDVKSDVKPNPLTLVTALTKGNRITLNNEHFGNLNDLSVFKEKLKKIFKAREKNGVVREGTNDIEKTVYLKIPLSAKFADLIKISRALQNAGADPIGLQVDDLPDWTVDSRRKLVEIQ